MFTVKEMFDIQLIAQVRKTALGVGMDDLDNLSWQAGLFEDGEVLATGRLYRRDEDIVIDRVAVLTAERAHREMMFRSLLLKALSFSPRRIIVPVADSWYEKFGFTADEDGAMSVEAQKAVFPHECKACGGCGE